MLYSIVIMGLHTVYTYSIHNIHGNTHTVLWVIGTPVKVVTHILRMIGTPNAGETKT